MACALAALSLAGCGGGGDGGTPASATPSKLSDQLQVVSGDTSVANGTYTLTATPDGATSSEGKDTVIASNDAFFVEVIYAHNDATQYVIYLEPTAAASGGTPLRFVCRSDAWNSVDAGVFDSLFGPDLQLCNSAAVQLDLATQHVSINGLILTANTDSPPSSITISASFGWGTSLNTN